VGKARSNGIPPAVSEGEFAVVPLMAR
jgi:hypothetical protein